MLAVPAYPMWCGLMFYVHEWPALVVVIRSSGLCGMTANGIVNCISFCSREWHPRQWAPYKIATDTFPWCTITRWSTAKYVPNTHGNHSHISICKFRLFSSSRTPNFIFGNLLEWLYSTFRRNSKILFVFFFF